MRLLDLISQGRTAPIHTNDGGMLTGAERFTAAVRACPIRYVLADELIRCATQLAFADGDRLTSCMDLIRVPAQSLWLEWLEAPRRAELSSVPTLQIPNGGGAQRGGALLSTSPQCRAGEIRTFWSMDDGLAYVSPVITQFNLDKPFDHDTATEPFADRGFTSVSAPAELGLNDLLAHVRFRFAPDWATYYGRYRLSPAQRERVLRGNLGTCAFDPPMLFAFFLMHSAREALPHRPVSVDRLNQARKRAGKPALLDHVEISAPIGVSRSFGTVSSAEWHERRSPRLHHVCGHLVRRGSTVFWRVPHLRGSARLGRIRTRTVELSFASQKEESIAVQSCVQSTLANR
jgi:hypothetical protein